MKVRKTERKKDRRMKGRKKVGPFDDICQNKNENSL